MTVSSTTAPSSGGPEELFSKPALWASFAGLPRHGACPLGLHKAGLLDSRPDVDTLRTSRPLHATRTARRRTATLVSILESRDALAIGARCWRADARPVDIPPSAFGNVKHFRRTSRSTILASARHTGRLASHRLGPDSRRFVDGALVWLRESRATLQPPPDRRCPLHSPYCDPIPPTARLGDGTGFLHRSDEVRPGRTMSRIEGSWRIRTFHFSEDILSWIEQGHEDAMRCVGDVKRALDLVHKSREARAARDRAVDALDEDGFGSA